MKVSKHTPKPVPRTSSGEKGKPAQTVGGAPVKSGHPHTTATPHTVPSGNGKGKK